MDRHISCETDVRAFHQVIHFNPAKNATANTHINCQGAKHKPKTTATVGRVRSGTQPIQPVEEGVDAVCKTLSDCTRSLQLRSLYNQKSRETMVLSFHCGCSF